MHKLSTIKSAWAVVGAILFASACTVGQAPNPSGVKLDGNAAATVALPLLSGWYDGNVVFYITTDVSQKEMAGAAGANYVPRLRHALRAPEPGQASAVDRVYKVLNFDQGSVFPSAPRRKGGADGDTDTEYTPFWVVYQVSWLAGSTPHLLRSEQEISDAEEKKLVRIEATDIVVNCPILFFAKDGPPDGMAIRKLDH